MIVAGKTHRGMVRKNNQDTFLTRLHTEQDSALLVVCDGMGGAAAGNIASTIAANTFAERVDELFENTPSPSIRALRVAVDRANEAVFGVYQQSGIGGHGHNHGGSCDSQPPYCAHQHWGQPRLSHSRR